MDNINLITIFEVIYAILLLLVPFGILQIWLDVHAIRTILEKNKEK